MEGTTMDELALLAEFDELWNTIRQQHPAPWSHTAASKTQSYELRDANGSIILDTNGNDEEHVIQAQSDVLRFLEVLPVGISWYIKETERLETLWEECNDG
jgi:hypothetical protein